MKKTFLICSVSLLALGSCNTNAVKGNGHVVTKNYTQTGFKDIEASSDLEVHLAQGPHSVKLEGDENIIKLMHVTVEGDDLKIGMQDNMSISASRPVKVFITAPEFREIEGSGACIFSGKITSTVPVKIDLKRRLRNAPEDRCAENRCRSQRCHRDRSRRPYTRLFRGCIGSKQPELL